MLRRAGFSVAVMLFVSTGLKAQTSIDVKPTQGSNVSATLTVVPMGKGVHFRGTVSGLTPGKHGFHIHEKGDCSAPDGSSAGGHFNPDQKPHGALDAAEHHAGDLGNIEAAADGTAKIDMHVNGLTLGTEPNSVKGKAIIIHGGADDFTTQPTGNAGGRLACGVIS
jgi:superoxide dismutase, Cu-Zn family